MDEVFSMLQDRYRDLIARSASGVDEDLLESIRLFLSDAHQAGAMIADPGQRGQLRAYMRFLATLLAEAGEPIPATDLLPLDQERWPEPERAASARRGTPPWVWAVVGAGIVAILAGLIAVGGVSMGMFPPQPTATPSPPPPTPSPTPQPSPTPSPTATPTPTPTPVPPPPAFGDITVALGVLSSGEPVLVGDTFDWNTKIVYAVFDFQGMRDGLAWSAVWTRNGQEVARENHLWDEDRYGRSGTYWVALFNPEGPVLWGGDYTVSLYIEDQLQSEAAFRIRYYVPATP